jgi:dipeptidyl aminopeptidase/acylaminoacyl peptidase
MPSGPGAEPAASARATHPLGSCHHRRMTAFDLDHFLGIPRLSGLRLSPDGTRLVVAVSRPDAEGKKFASAIWEVDPAGTRPPRRLTRSAPGESNATFLRDGSLLFTSSRPDPDRPSGEKEDDDVNALWLLPTGGEARVVAAPHAGVDGVAAARDADVIVFAAGMHPGAVGLSDDRERERARTKAGVEAHLFERFPIRFWDHYLGPRERRLFAGAVPESPEARISEPADLTPAPANHLDEVDFDITPDGSTIVTGWLDTSELTSPRVGIVAIDRAGGAQRTIADDAAWYSEVRCSPDGRWVVAVRMGQPDPDHAPDQTLWLFDIESGAGRDLTPELDLWPHGPTWAPDASAVFFVADRQGHAAAFRVDIETGMVTLLAGDGTYGDLAPAPDGRHLYALRSTVSTPPHVVVLDARAGEQTPRVIPSPAMPEDELGVPGLVERVTARAADGVEVGSWLVRPPTSSPSEPAPLVVFIHGGPLGSWNGWHWRWNPHLLAERGYAVLLPDPALSTGYGLEFIRRGWGRWGEAPYTDLMAAVDAAVARPDIDEGRTAAMGGSFGGYMANWVAGHTDRFRAIVTHASLWELRGFHGTTDFGPEWEAEFGDPYRDPSRYEAASPDRHVGSIRTPMLVIHGEKDHRVPISEALRLWTDLSRHGVEARFLYFPDENHWVLKPPNVRLWYETVLAFLDHHVRDMEWRRPALV